MDENLVSIIIPIYNVQSFLNECINSLLKQTYSNIEVLLINDGSTDKSEEICREYCKKDSRLSYFYQSNSGVSSARNKGINYSKGNYILFVDADDYVEPSFVEEMLASLKINEVDCVQCGYKKKIGDRVHIELRGQEYIISGNEITEGLLQCKGYGRTWCMLYKKNIIGNYRFNESLSLGEDSEFNLRVLNNAQRLFYINKPLYTYRVSKNSTVKRYDKNYCEKYKKTADAVLKYSESDSSLYRKAQVYICYILVQILINYSCNREANKRFIYKTRSVREVCSDPIFKYAIKNAVISREWLSFWVLVKIIGLKQYWLAAILCNLRNIS